MDPLTVTRNSDSFCKGSCVRIFAQCLVLLCALCSSAYGQLHEVFPLRPGLRYGYQMDRISIHLWVVILEDMRRDSGSVQYLIHDTTTVGDSVHWQIEMITQLLTREYVSGVMDTMFFQSDTVSFILRESLTGYHTLSTPAYPWTSNTVHPDTFPHPWWGLNVQRYSADSVSVHDSCTFGGHVCDSVRMQQSTGVNFRLFRSRAETHNRYYDTMRAELTGIPTLSVSDERNAPSAPTLFQNYPNPFNPATMIEYIVPTTSHVNLRIVDLLGREVAVLVDEIQLPGRRLVGFNGKGLASGIYICQISMSGVFQSRKLLLLR